MFWVTSFDTTETARVGVLSEQLVNVSHLESNAGLLHNLCRYVGLLGQQVTVDLLEED